MFPFVFDYIPGYVLKFFKCFKSLAAVLLCTVHLKFANYFVVLVLLLRVASGSTTTLDFISFRNMNFDADLVSDGICSDRFWIRNSY